MSLHFPSSRYINARPKSLAEHAVRILRNPPRTPEGQVDPAVITRVTNELAVALLSQGYPVEHVLALLDYWSQPDLKTPAHEVSSDWSDETFEQLHDRILSDIKRDGLDLTSADAGRARASLTACYLAFLHGSGAAGVAEQELRRPESSEASFGERDAP